MNRRHRSGASGLLLASALLALACDARDAPTTSPPPREADPSMDLERPEGAAATPTRDLAQLELELAAKEAELRQLGITIVATPTSEAEEEPAPEQPDASETTAVEHKPAPAPGGRGKAKDRKADKAGGGSKTTTTKAKKEAEKTPSGVPRGDAGGQTEFIDGDANDVMPDPAKAIPNTPTPTDRPAEQAEDRCPLICSLAEGTCELTDEICELADRHSDDDAYTLACERASSDCTRAREACLECLG